ncbi:MAG: hypothetical protein AAFX65_13205 [Cyanobacteria bacterium J06638_7]
MLNNHSQSSFQAGQRVTRRRSSAGPLPPVRPQRARPPLNRGLRPTYLTLRDHGRVYVADLPRLSDGQLSRLLQESREMQDSLCRRLGQTGNLSDGVAMDEDTRIRAATKRDVTERFIRAITEEQECRRSNPALRAAADESLARAFLELARHRLPGATFESLLQEALAACGPQREPAPPVPQVMPVVLTPAAEPAAS